MTFDLPSTRQEWNEALFLKQPLQKKVLQLFV